MSPNIEFEVFYDNIVSDPSDRRGYRIKCRYGDDEIVARGEIFSVALRGLADQIERIEYDDGEIETTDEAIEFETRGEHR